jgi:transposase
MSQNLNSAIAVIGIDIGKNSFHVVGLDGRGARVLRQWSRARSKPGWPICRPA